MKHHAPIVDFRKFRIHYDHLHTLKMNCVVLACIHRLGSSVPTERHGVNLFQNHMA